MEGLAAMGTCSCQYDRVHAASSHRRTDAACSSACWPPHAVTATCSHQRKTAWLHACRSTGDAQAQEQLVRLLRLLRNAPAIGGPPTAAMLVTCRAAHALAHAVHALLSPAHADPSPPPEADSSAAQCTKDVDQSGSAEPASVQLPCTLIAQALANLTQSGEAACEEVWSACWPHTWQSLLGHPSSEATQA